MRVCLSALFLLLCLSLPLAAQQPFSVSMRQVVSDDSARPVLYVISGADLIYRSADSGATWTPVYVLEAGLPQPEARDLLVEPTFPKNLYLATTLASGGVWKTTDAGTTWSRANTGLPGGTGAVERLYATASPAALYARIGNQLYKSTDGASSWKLQSTLPGSGGALVISPSRPTTMYFARSLSIYRTRDEGAAWSMTAELRPYSSCDGVGDLGVDAQDPTMVYAARCGCTVSITENGVFYRPNGFHRSTNSGETWVQTETGCPIRITVDLPGRPNVYAIISVSGGVHKMAVTARSSGLANGVYSASIRISSRATANSEVSIPMRLNVTPRPAGLPEYRISNWGGDGRYGVGGDNRDETASMLAGPTGLSVDHAGNLWIADSGSGGIRRLTPHGAITSPALFVMLPPAYAAARHHPDYHLVARPDQFPGCGDPLNCPPREAATGGIVLLYGTGFGPVNPPIPAGQLFDTPNVVAGKLRVRFGTTWVEALGGLASPGLYQIAAQVPESAPDGDLEVVAEVDGKQSPAVRIPVRRR